MVYASPKPKYLCLKCAVIANKKDKECSKCKTETICRFDSSMEADRYVDLWRDPMIPNQYLRPHPKFHIKVEQLQYEFPAIQAVMPIVNPHSKKRTSHYVRTVLADFEYYHYELGACIEEFKPNESIIDLNLKASTMRKLKDIKAAVGHHYNVLLSWPEEHVVHINGKNTLHHYVTKEIKLPKQPTSKK